MNESKLMRVYTKITVEQVCVFEGPKQNYERISDGNDGQSNYGYVSHPTEVQKEERKEVLYEQKFDEGALDVRELTLWANRVR